jgi:hypothetical protein
MNILRWAALGALAFTLVGSREPCAAETIYSGPQPGEKTTPFQVLEIRGAHAGEERDPVVVNDGKPMALVFVHGLERSIVPLISVIDQYGAERGEALNVVYVFLSADRVSSEKQLPLAGESLRLKSPLTLSLDGREGPGNYGLNKDCLMTVVVAKENRVTANFALVQPGIADAEKVIAAMAKASGDSAPPAIAALQERRGGGYGRMAAERRPAGDSLPGAAPTDEKLIGLLRAFIRQGNDEATVDRLVKQVEEYASADPGLKQQAIDGWTRVIHLNYGTEYALRQGRALIGRLQTRN